MGAVEQSRRGLRVAEYQRMADVGIIGPEERVELIEGEIYAMSPQKRPHIVGTGLTRDILSAMFGPGWIVLSQMTVQTSDVSQPEPDVSVVRGGWRDYDLAPATLPVLVVEVADTSLQYDRTTKAALYARAGIPEYWILNLTDRVLEVHRDPDPDNGTYRDVLYYREGDSLAPLAAPGAVIAVADLLP